MNQSTLSLRGTPITVTSDDVCSQLKRLRANKTQMGSCHVPLRCVQTFLQQLIFSLSLSQSKNPVRWKTSCIVHVPIKPNARGPDLWPIALTSQLMKILERVVLGHFNRQVSEYQDPLQFAYMKGVGVDDALLSAGATARILFLDFSNAFNTIHLT